MRRIRIPLLLFLLSSPEILPGQDNPAVPSATERIKAIVSENEKGYRNKILPAHEKALAELAEKYVQAVEKEKKRVADAGNLDAALEVRDELKRLEKGEAIEDGEGGEFSKIPELRDIYREQLAKLKAGHLDRQASIAKAVEEKLSALAMTYVKAGDDAAAKEVVAARDKAKNLGLPFITGREWDTVRSGPLRAFVNVRDPYPPVDISIAEPYDDFTKVILMAQGNWAALRENGTVISTHPKFKGKTGIADITKSVILYKDGRIEVFEGPGAGIKEGGERVFASLRNNIAIMEDGSVEAWGGAYKQGGSALPPKDLTDVVTIAADLGHRAYAVRSDGSVVMWGKDDAKNILPEKIPGLVELSAGWGHFAGRTKDGKVLAWPPGPSWTRVPDDLPRIIKVCARCRITAAQKEDLSWIAWGEKKMGVCDKINEIGPALDIAYESNGRGWGYLLWIEPK